MKNLTDYINESFEEEVNNNNINESEVEDSDIKEYLTEQNKESKICSVTLEAEEISYNEDVMDYLMEMSESVIDTIGEQERAVLESFNINPDEVLCFKHSANEDDASETITYAVK